MAGKERREGKVEEEGGGGNSLAKEQKAGLMITRDLEMGTRRTEASSRFSFNLHSSLDLPFLF